ncbi:secreted protein [Alkalispirillum mobile]|uniref:Secreted protein n=1 Tax=Alkalispirillum mobile TaxID=85925 RepID=A0A498CDD9_9GAMM|nr:twin-arginine translocation signal domain-containing protein [Alkalispirillum mobile]RLK50251.1 secreted protein [Alkalispirillum mobile]
MKHSEKESGVRQDRRQFMKTMAVGGAAVGVGMTGGQALAIEPEAEPETRSLEKRGYHETAHIQDYYRKAEF